MIVKICEIAQLTRATPGSSLVCQINVPCCCMPLATCLTHLAYLGCVFLLYGQKIGLSYTCSCQFLPCDISLPWCMVAKLVRKVARSMQQHGICQFLAFEFEDKKMNLSWLRMFDLSSNASMWISMNDMSVDNESRLNLSFFRSEWATRYFKL